MTLTGTHAWPFGQGAAVSQSAIPESAQLPTSVDEWQNDPLFMPMVSVPGHPLRLSVDFVGLLLRQHHGVAPGHWDVAKHDAKKMFEYVPSQADRPFTHAWLVVLKS